MSVFAEIEIAASPEEVRQVFFDFKHWHEIKNNEIRSVSRIPPNRAGPVEKGEKLDMNLNGMKSQFVVLENTAEEFTWRGDLLYIFSGIHTFRFEPSKTTPGATRFVNEEKFARFNVVFMRLMPAQKIFYQFCEDFKAMVESVKKESASGNREAV